jgi:hypothetical protein
MNLLKWMGVVVLAVFSLSGAVRVVSNGLGLAAMSGAMASEVQSLAIGHFIGSVLIEVLIVYGLFKLIRSMKKHPADHSDPM